MNIREEFINAVRNYGDSSYVDVLRAIEEGNTQRITETSMARVWQHVNGAGKDGFAIVSAWRGDRPKEENEKNTKELEDHIRKSGYGYVPMHGVWQGSKEPSYLVPKASQKWSSEVRAKYNQDAVIHSGPESKGRVTLLNRDGSTEDIGGFHPKAVGDAFSRLKKGGGQRDFSFGDKHESKVPFFEWSEPTSWIQAIMYEHHQRKMRGR